MAFDRKNEPERPGNSPGEILFFNVVMPILASDEMALDLPIPVQDRAHPLWTCHGATSSTKDIQIESLLDGGVRFVDSADDVLIQLADVLAYVLRRAATRVDDSNAARSYTAARKRLFMRTPVMFGGKFETLRRYHHILR